LLKHGGDLRTAAHHYGIALQHWLDLSTGINPCGWSPPIPPAVVWQRLPEQDDGLERAAAEYYGSDRLLPTAGAQAALQALPVLRTQSRVGVLSPGYAEHAHAWRRHGHTVELLAGEAIEDTVDRLDVVVVSNPNNPTGVRFALTTLLNWRLRLAERGGWLVVDESFIDVTPEYSLANQAGLPGLIVLRSLGKFFGLAGARVGFVLAEAALLQQLREWLGPWTISGPGRWVATLALQDRAWQETMRQSLPQASARLAKLLRRQGLTVSGGAALFQWVQLTESAFYQAALARRGIWVRYFDEPPSLRFGLPALEASWQRLELALAGVRAERLMRL